MRGQTRKKKPPWGDMDIFWDHTIRTLMLSHDVMGFHIAFGAARIHFQCIACMHWQVKPVVLCADYISAMLDYCVLINPLHHNFVNI